MALLSEVLASTASEMGVTLPRVEVIGLFGDLLQWDRREGDTFALMADPALQYTTEARYVALHAILGEIRYFAAPCNGGVEDGGPREWGTLATPADAVHLIARYLAGDPLESIAAERRPPPFRSSVRCDVFAEGEDPGTIWVFRPGEPPIECTFAGRSKVGSGDPEG